MASCLAVVGLFALLLLGLALLERLGIAVGLILQAAVVGVCLLSLVIALTSHGRRPADFYIGEGMVVAELGGLALASSLAGLLVIALAGRHFVSGIDIVAAVCGLLAGVLFSGVLIAPRLRRYGGYTPGDFYRGRFGRTSRLVAAVVAFAASALLLIAYLKTAGPLLAALTGIGDREAIMAAAAVVALVVVLGGMRALTWTQLFQYFVVALACFVPAAILALNGDVLGAGLFGSVNPADTIGRPWPLGATAVQSVQTLFLFATGAVTLPPLLARHLAAPTDTQAAASTLWSLLFTVALIAGVLVFVQSLAQATGSAPSIGADPLTSLWPLLAALPSVLSGLVLAGICAALLAIGQAALLSAAATLSHDFWDAAVERRGEGRRILVARLLIVAVAAAATWLAFRWTLDGSETLGWAFAVAAAGYLFPLLAGFWWPRCNAAASVLGMLSGFGVAGLVMLLDLGMLPSLESIHPSGGYGPAAGASLGLSASFLVTGAASLLNRAPDIEDAGSPVRDGGLQVKKAA